MFFKGYLAASELDIDVAKANGTLLEWYGSKEELYYDCGEDADVTEIEIQQFEIELPDGHWMEFDSIGLN